MVCSMPKLLRVFLLLLSTACINAQDLQLNLNNLTIQLNNLTYALQPKPKTIKKEQEPILEAPKFTYSKEEENIIRTFITAIQQLSPEERNKIFSKDPQQLAQLLAGQTISAPQPTPSETEPSAAPVVKAPPPPPPMPQKQPPVLSDEEKRHIKFDYTRTLEATITNFSEQQTISYLSKEKQNIEKEIKRVQNNLAGLTGNDLVQEKKKLEAVRTRLGVLNEKLKPYAETIKKQQETQTNLMEQMKQAIEKRGQTINKPDEFGKQDEWD